MSSAGTGAEASVSTGGVGSDVTATTSLVFKVAWGFGVFRRETPAQDQEAPSLQLSGFPGSISLCITVQ